MAELEDPQQELACQKRADGLSQKAAYAASGYADGKNGPRFFRQKQVAKRVREIVARRAVLADLDDAWVLARLKRIADVNLDDYYAHNDKGERIHIDLTQVPREKMAALAEVYEEIVLEKHGVEENEFDRIRKTRIKPISSVAAIELIGKHIGMWPNRSQAQKAADDEAGRMPYDDLLELAARITQEMLKKRDRESERADSAPAS